MRRTHTVPGRRVPSAATVISRDGEGPAESPGVRTYGRAKHPQGQPLPRLAAALLMSAANVLTSV